ncbi:MAG: SDR family NAD(P)-dependent oxidoreductase [Candidatus Odinarchaeota archaeon]
MNWSEKTVLVTGACGFIGSHLVEQLQSTGAEVRVFARYTSSASLGNLSFLPEKEFEVFYGDLRNPYRVHDAMKDVDIVFHLASLISIPYSYANPTEYFDVNVNAILNILQAARDLSTELVIHTSTSEVYGTAKYVPIDEKHPLQGQSPYSASKIAADKVAESFYLSFDTPVFTVRPFNTFGPRQSTRAIIPSIIKQLITGPNLYLGDLSPTRDLLYVKDTAAGFITAAIHAKKLLGQTVNIGTGREIDMKSLAELIGKIMNVKPVFHVDQSKLRPSDSEVLRLCCDATLFTSLTAWTPKYTLEQALEETIAFYREFGEQIHQSPFFI